MAKVRIPRFCRLCGGEIKREPGKRGAPPVFCADCKEIGEREYMRNYMRDYRAVGRRKAPTVAPLTDSIEAERVAEET